MADNNSVMQEWLYDLSFQQQTVLLMALRGPDGFPKYHASKAALYFLRACVCKSAPHGRDLRDTEHLGSFMDYRARGDAKKWDQDVALLESVIDELPLHYFTHFMHAAQILAYLHPDATVRVRWRDLYQRCADYLHMPMEPAGEMCSRLNDFGRNRGEERDVWKR